MGVDISFDRRVYKLEEREGFEADIYAFLEKHGSDNVRTMEGNIARNWDVMAVGTIGEVMIDRIIKLHAPSCERGMLRFQNSRSTKPENYIKKWREAIDNAGTSEDLQKDFGINHKDGPKVEPEELIDMEVKKRANLIIVGP